MSLLLTYLNHKLRKFSKAMKKVLIILLDFFLIFNFLFGDSSFEIPTRNNY